MNAIVNFLFPKKSDTTSMSWLLLAFRLLFGILFLIHGVQKLMNFETLSGSFPDPLGVGSNISLMLAIFGEVACSIGFIVGALYRLALIPMIFTMGIAFFVIHGGDPFAARELAFVYGIAFMLMYITGPGKYSLDYMVATRLSGKQ